MIKDNDSRENHFFSIVTESYRDYYYDLKIECEVLPSLERIIVGFCKEDTVIRDGTATYTLIDGMYRRAADIGLGKLVKQAAASDDEIPTVTPEEVSVRELIETGCCFDSDGSAHLPFPL